MAVPESRGILEPRTIRMTVPLFIRLLEFAREDAKSDLDLHYVAENATECGARTLDMDDYGELIEK